MLLCCGQTKRDDAVLHTQERLNIALTGCNPLNEHGLNGSIRCTISEGSGQYQIHWLETSTMQSALLSLNDERLCASGVRPGDYTVSVKDVVTGAVAENNIILEVLDIPSVVGYDVTNASSDTARDGSIVARLHNLTCTRFLWTTGVITALPELNDVRPGVYTVTPMSDDSIPLSFMHLSPPAVIQAFRTSMEMHV